MHIINIYLLFLILIFYFISLLLVVKYKIYSKTKQKETRII